MTKYTRLSLSHDLACPTKMLRTPWRAFTMATRLVAIPVAAPAFSQKVTAQYLQMFDPAAQFVPVYYKQPRRSHIQAH